MKNLPKEFKFKKSNNPQNNIKFILKIHEEGFNISLKVEDFISKYAFSDQVFAYLVEDNYLKILLKNFDEKVYNSYDIPEIIIDDFEVELNEENENILNSSILINDTISKLSKLNLKELSNKELEIINKLNSVLS